jgi:5-methylcytosine-specific restriction endonuclease McrA
MGGPNAIWNLAPAHFTCNYRRGIKLPQAARLELMA